MAQAMWVSAGKHRQWTADGQRACDLIYYKPQIEITLCSFESEGVPPDRNAAHTATRRRHWCRHWYRHGHLADAALAACTSSMCTPRSPSFISTIPAMSPRPRLRGRIMPLDAPRRASHGVRNVGYFSSPIQWCDPLSCSRALSSSLVLYSTSLLSRFLVLVLLLGPRPSRLLLGHVSGDTTWLFPYAAPHVPTKGPAGTCSCSCQSRSCHCRRLPPQHPYSTLQAPTRSMS
jgi:hypothetical protein